MMNVILIRTTEVQHALQRMHVTGWQGEIEGARLPHQYRASVNSEAVAFMSMRAVLVRAFS